MTTIILANGVILDDGGVHCESLCHHIEYCELPNLRVFLAKHPDGTKEYILVDGEEVIFASPQSAEIWSRVDLCKLIGKEPADAVPADELHAGPEVDS